MTPQDYFWYAGAAVLAVLALGLLAVLVLIVATLLGGLLKGGLLPSIKFPTLSKALLLWTAPFAVLIEYKLLQTFLGDDSPATPLFLSGQILSFAIYLLFFPKPPHATS